MSETLVIGFAARSLVTGCMMPVSVIKTRYESGRYNYRTVLQAGRDTIAKEGLKGEHGLENHGLQADCKAVDSCPSPCCSVLVIVLSALQLVIDFVSLLQDSTEGLKRPYCAMRHFLAST